MPVSFHGSVSSPVRSRIASLEAQAQASNNQQPQNEQQQQQAGYSTTPSAAAAAAAAAAASGTTTTATTLSDRQHAFFKQQKQQQQQQQSQVHTNNPSASPTPTDASPGRDSTTTTASQNRINRIRQQQQQQQSVSPTSQPLTTGAGGNNSHSQASNLMEKRKHHHQRRMVMKQQHQHQQDPQSSVGVSQPSADSPAATTTPTKNSTTTTPNNNNNSGSRLSKMHRMQKRKGYDHVKSRQHLNSKLGGSVSAADAAAAAAVAGADTTATGSTTNTSSSSSGIRRQQRQSSRHNHTVQLPAVLSGASSSFSPRSPNGFSALGLDTSHENTATSRDDGGTVTTDEGDDATLTSVRRVMMGGGGGGGGSSGGDNNQSQYEHLQSHLGGGHHASSSGGRPSTASTIVVNHNHNSRRRGGTGNGGGKQSGSNNSDNLRGWIDEEKSNKDHNSAFLSSSAGGGGGGGGGVDRLIRTASSSDYDTDGDVSKASRRSRQSATNLHRLLIDGGPSHSQVTDVNDFFTNPASKYGQSGGSKVDANGDNNSITQPYGAGSAGFSSSNAHPHHHQHPHQPQGQGRYNTDDDDRTFDYGDRDEGNDGGIDADYDSDASGSYAKARRRRRQKQTLGKQGTSHKTGSASVLSKESPSKKGNRDGGDGETMNLLNAEDMEKYSKAMENPAVKLGAGVVGVATVGCVAFGPVGLLVGVAAVGLGFGVMQIPEEERSKIQEKAEKGFHTLQEKACDASETLSSNCLTTYKDSGVADHIPHCYSGTDVISKEFETERAENFRNTNFEDPKIGGGTYDDANQPAVQDDPIAAVNPGQSVPGQNSTGPSVPQSNERTRNKKVACLRNVRILPASQIYSLDPATQPRAWIDIVASANTTDAEKNEAMEEILLLAKDKRRAKIFLDEGILDSAVWSLSRYFEKLDSDNEQSIDWTHPLITPQEKTAANLAAQVCVTLGKAHCAAIHTEGDLMLMSQYEHGTVPEERQVAQMLHEVPHHVRVTKTNDPTTIIPSKEVFALRQLTLPQAEELARSIKAVAEGRM